MAFNIDNYVDVPTRLAEAMKRWPNLRIQETNAEVVTMPDGSTFYRCTVTVWRDETDLLPSIAINFCFPLTIAKPRLMTATFGGFPLSVLFACVTMLFRRAKCLLFRPLLALPHHH